MSPVRATCVPPQNSIDSRRCVTHAHLVAVLLAEERHRARLLAPRRSAAPRCRRRRSRGSRALTRSSTCAHLARRSAARSARSRSAGDRARPASPSARRASPSTVAQRLVQQVRRRVVARGCASRRSSSTASSTVSPTRERARRRPRRGGRTSVAGRLLACRRRATFAAGAASVPVSPIWPPGLAVERRLGGDDRDVLRVRADRVDLLAVGDQRDDLRLAGGRLVAEELRRADSLGDLPGTRPRPRPRPSPANSLRSRCSSISRVEAGLVDRRSRARSAMISREVEREAEGVVELEHDLAGQRLLAGLRHRRARRRGSARPRSSVSRKRFSSSSATLADQSRALAQLRVRRRPSSRSPSPHSSCRNGSLDAEQLAVADRAAHDPAQHVPRPSLSGNTPSAIRNAAARAWSAITRIETSSPRSRARRSVLPDELAGAAR